MVAAIAFLLDSASSDVSGSPVDQHPPTLEALKVIFRISRVAWKFLTARAVTSSLLGLARSRRRSRDGRTGAVGPVRTRRPSDGSIREKTRIETARRHYECRSRRIGARRHGARRRGEQR